MVKFQVVYQDEGRSLLSVSARALCGDCPINSCRICVTKYEICLRGKIYYTRLAKSPGFNEYCQPSEECWENTGFTRAILTLLGNKYSEVSSQNFYEAKLV